MVRLRYSKLTFQSGYGDKVRRGMQQTMVISKLEKKQKGIFYTPKSLIQLLCDWSIQHESNTILEPSFGGCGFLKESIARLNILGCSHPETQICGCDIDESAFTYLGEFLEDFDKSYFIKGDFLAVKNHEFPIAPVDVVLGNPPYIAYHNMSTEQRESVRDIKYKDVSLPYTSSLWAHFIIHSLNFIKEGGRLAFILPTSFFYTDYAKKIHILLKKHFSKSVAISLSERLFLKEGTDEKSIVLLCSGFSDSIEGEMKFGHAEDLDSLEDIIYKWHEGVWNGEDFIDKLSLLAKHHDFTLFRAIQSQNDVIKLGNILRVKIGVVTGDNNFFLLDEHKAKEINIPTNYLTPILSKFPNFGIEITDQDVNLLKERTKKCLLIDTSQHSNIDSQVQKYLDSYPRDRSSWPLTFNKRPIWHKANDGNTSDAFFPYMHDYGPCILLNTAKITCTNTIHRIYFLEENKILQKLSCISILTTFSQISAELVGRSYGSGVLKHEPSELVKIDIRIPINISIEDIDSEFTYINELMRQGCREDAQRRADKFIFSDMYDVLQFTQLHELLNKLKNIRK